MYSAFGSRAVLHTLSRAAEKKATLRDCSWLNEGERWETRLELHPSAPIISPSMLQLAPEQLLKICLLFSTLLLHQYKMELLRSNKRSTSTKNLNITDTELPLAVPLKICSSRSQRKWLTVRRFSMFLSQKQIKSSYTQKHDNDHVYFWSL